MSNIPFHGNLIYARAFAESNFDTPDQFVNKFLDTLTHKYTVPSDHPSVVIKYSFLGIRTLGQFIPPNTIILNKIYLDKLFTKYKSSNQLEKDLATLLMIRVIVHEYAHYLQQFYFLGHKRKETDPDIFAHSYTGIDERSTWILDYLLNFGEIW